MINLNGLLIRLPQKYPFLLIDGFSEVEAGKKAVAFKNVSINEYFFKGHFPGNPIMPGTLIIEAMAQTAIALFMGEEPDNAVYYLGNVKAKFINPVYPGDRLRLEAKPIKIMRDMGLVEASAHVDDKEVAKAEIGFSIKRDGR